MPVFFPTIEKKHRFCHEWKKIGSNWLVCIENVYNNQKNSIIGILFDPIAAQ